MAESSFEPATEAGQDPEIIVRTFIGGLAGRPRPEGSDFWSGKDTPLPPDSVVLRNWSRYFLLSAAQSCNLQLPVHLAK